MALTGRFDFRPTLTGRLALLVEYTVEVPWPLSRLRNSFTRWRPAKMKDLAAVEVRALMDLRNRPYLPSQSDYVEALATMLRLRREKMLMFGGVVQADARSDAIIRTATICDAVSDDASSGGTTEIDAAFDVTAAPTDDDPDGQAETDAPLKEAAQTVASGSGTPDPDACFGGHVAQPISLRVSP